MKLTATVDEPVGAGIDFADPNSPWARWYLTVPAVVAVGLVAAVFLMFNHVPLWHTDIWGHLAWGEWIVSHGEVPTRDPFLAAADAAPAGARYAWLSQVLFALTYRAGHAVAGFAGGVAVLRVLHATLTAARVACFVVAVRRKAGSTGYAAGAAAGVLLVNLGNAGVSRPQVFGELAAALLLIPLSRPALSRRTVVLIPLLLAAWANLHASYAVGLLLLLVVFVGRGLDLSWNPARWYADADLRRLALAGILAGVAVAVLNPAGPRIYANTLSMAAHPVVRLMDEWQPLAWTWGAGGHWAYAATVIAAVLLRVAGGRPLPWESRLVLLAFGVQPLFQQRALVWWIAFAPWALAPCAAALLARRPALRSLAGVPSLRKTVVAAAVVVLAMAWSLPTQWLLDGRPPAAARSVSRGTPYALVEALLAPADRPAGLAAALSRYPNATFAGGVYGTETQGDYLLWRLGPAHPVFITSHVHLIGRDLWEESVQVRRGTPAGLAALDRERVNLIVAEADRNPVLRAALLSRPAEWAVVLDETGDRAKPDPRTRLLAAVRREPK